MPSAAANPLVGVLGWYFVPSFAASLLLRAVYSAVPNAKPLIYDLQPTPEVVEAANAKAQWHQRLSHSCVVVGYLAYTLSSAYQSLINDANHYRMLGLRVLPFDSVPEELWDRELKQQWRALVKVAHPDKVGQAGEAAFVMMRTAYETLSDGLKKDAYDRFGQSVIASCAGKCTTQREFIRAGAFASSGFYIVVLGTLLLLSMTRQNEASTYWRYSFLALLFSAEYTLVTRPLSTIIQWSASAGLAPWQLVVLLHHLYVAATMGINHLSPLFFPRPPTNEHIVEAVAPYLSRIRQLAVESEMEAFVQMRNDAQPLINMANTPEAVKGNEVVFRRLKQGMIDSMVDSAVRADEEGAALWRQAVQSRHQPKREEADGLPDDADDAQRVMDAGLAKSDADSFVRVKAEPVDDALNA